MGKACTLFSSFNPHITLGDGTVVSVQASKFMYCEPREDFSPSGYASVEVMWMKPYYNPAGWTDYGDGIHPYVPLEEVSKQCWYHGGIVSGKLPRAQLRLTHQPKENN